MKLNLIKYTMLIVSGVLLSAGCDKPSDDDFTTGTDRTLTVQLKPDGLSSFGLSDTKSTTSVDETSIGSVTGYRFTEGILREIIPGSGRGTDGVYTFPTKELTGEIYFIANDDTQIFNDLQPGITRLSQFLALDAAAESMVGERLLMTGWMNLEESLSTLPAISMRRSVARIDIVSQDRGVTVQSVSIDAVADRGYVNTQPEPHTPASAKKTDFQKDYTDTPLENDSETLLYLCEQSGTPLTVEVIACFGGGRHRLTTSLPAQIHRNRIYSLQIHGEGATLSLSVLSGDWEAGNSTDAQPDLKGLVDIEASTLPENVSVSSGCDSVFVSYQGGEFQLVLRAEADSEIDVEGHIRGVTTTLQPVANAKSLRPVAALSVTSDRRMPNEKRAYLYLEVHKESLFSGRIVLVFEPNPTRFTGIALDESGTCDFDRYIDGELGRITLPEGKTARVAFATDEDPWMKLSEEEETLRLLAGWKPNDPKADGRLQEGRIVISVTDGSNSESYLIRRRKWGLPVVRIGDTWWCKYNLRGNAKNFADQILIPDDPAADHELADYLNRCDDTELLRLMGDQYQGGNLQGLPLQHDGAAFYHEGMKSSGQNFGTLDPASMAPDGYRIPDYDDYAFFSGSNNYNLGGVGSRSYRNSAGEELSIRIIERDATFLGQNYGTVSFYEFQHGDSRWVLYGLGHQWNTNPGSISRMMLLLATYGNSANCWVMEGYAQNDRPNQNWLKFMNQNSTKTRVIRCIKSPVEYIYY